MGVKRERMGLGKKSGKFRGWGQGGLSEKNGAKRWERWDQEEADLLGQDPIETRKI